jgi:tetratricopeptide (TPR) repeat protein
MRRLIVFVAFMGISALSAFGQEPTNFSDSMENELYLAIKDQASGRSEAETEQAMGIGLLNADNQWKRAEKHFKKAVALEPTLYQAWYNLGLIYMGTDVGNGYFEKALKIKPDLAPAMYWLAYNYTRQGDDKRALPYWERYLEASKGQDEEKERIVTAREVLGDMRSGKEGKELRTIRIK